MKLSLILLLLQLWGNVELSFSQNACSKLPDVPHAHVSEETKKAEYQEGDVIHFPCEPGYISDHTSKYVCTGEGWLVVRRGMCYSCSKLPDVPHARVTEETRKAEYQEGDVIHFTCEPGYTSDLIIKYVCASEGWLAVRQGLCYNACQVGKMHSHLFVAGLPPTNETMKTGHKLQFQCTIDFQLDGSEEIECLETGQWSAPFPTCSEKCKVPRLPDNVNLRPGLSVRHLTKGQKLTFSCRQRGDFLQGNATIECLAGGQWSDSVPTCGPAVGCDKSPPLENGDTKRIVKFRHDHNEKVEYICQNFYLMEGEPFMTCSNGKWIGQMRCLKPCTVDIDAMTRNNIRFTHSHRNKLYSQHKDYITFSCVYGTRPVGSLAMRQECIDGVMLLPTCEESY